MDSELVPVQLDEIRFSEWLEAAGLSRSTAYELIKLLAIEPTPRKLPGIRKQVSFITADQAALLEPWAAAIVNGATMPQIRERIGSSEIVPATNPILSENIPGSSQTVQDSDLASRLEAAERAIASGLGLTTREVAWIIGVNPGGAFFTRGGITCTKTGKNCWLLTRS